ncbi:unnamed protein product [Symbiodinium pilosum]|uniref:Transmembrane protein n=1 Tax=Symbiodinium pilosum TaxID=2952 RepID=A0A812LNZ1_SYMPI|nr:unnamed protein product [Symbiodinium pilosum]
MADDWGVSTSVGVLRIPTRQLIEQQKQGAPVVLAAMFCMNSCCCVWIPVLFFLGAANVLTTCENYDRFTLWMRTYPLVPMCCGTLVQLLVTCLACVGNRSFFKLGLRLQALTGLAFVAAMSWGWYEYSITTEESCVGTGDINPRTLSLAFLVLGSVAAPSMLCTAVSRGCCGDFNTLETTEQSDDTV